VVVDEFKEEPGLIRFHAIIYVTRETQKMIIIGEGGRSIKRMSTDARRSLEDFLTARSSWRPP
jgi:GTP-binding protein Era